jgi:acyl dehydratase
VGPLGVLALAGGLRLPIREVAIRKDLCLWRPHRLQSVLPAKTVTESDDHLFCLITMNHHPLHLNDVYAGKSQQGRNVVVGPLVYSLALGMSVSDVSGKAIANLATEELKHPAPVFHGDTLYCESEVLEKKESRSKPDRGTVKVHTPYKAEAR